MKSSIPPPLGGYTWRRDRGLLVLSDHIRRYRAVRVPRGPYLIPLPADLIRGMAR